MAMFTAQDGWATVAQVREAGVTRGFMRSRVARGEWVHWDERVIGLGGVALTWRRRARAAALSIGERGALSHETAGRVHRFDGSRRWDAIHVTTFDGRHLAAGPGVVVHRSTELTAAMCTDVVGLPVVSKPLALVQVTAGLGREAGRQALDGLLRDGARPAWIHQVAEAWRRPGRTGPPDVLAMLHQATSERLPASWFQRLASDRLAAHGLRMEDEVPVADERGERLARLDLALPEVGIGVECQSWEWHGTPAARRADARRKRRLRLLGWEIVEVWWSDLDRMAEVAAEIEVLIRRRREGRGGQ